MAELQGMQWLANGLNQLASGCKKRFKVTDKLTIDDMVKLITPPKNPLLLEQGKFKFTLDHNKANLTSNGGAQVGGFVVPAYYGEKKTLLGNPATRPNLTLRIHFDVLKTDGAIINWGLEGTMLNGVWNPAKSNESDYELQTGLMVDYNNSLQFDAKGTTIINLATSYAEIIVGGVIKPVLSVLRRLNRTFKIGGAA